MVRSPPKKSSFLLQVFVGQFFQTSSNQRTEGYSDAIHCWERLAVLDEFRAKQIGRLMDETFMKSDEL